MNQSWFLRMSAVLESSITISEFPVVIDYQFQLRDFLATRLPVEANLFARWIDSVLPGNPLACDNSHEYLEPPYPPLPRIQVGELQWPSGASRYGRALYAVDWGTMSQIAKLVWGYTIPETVPNDVPSNWGVDLYPVQLRIAGETEVFQATMYPLAPYRVVGHGADLWLLPLVDKRYQWQRVMFAPGYESSPTWSELLNDILAAIGNAAATWTVPAAFASPDERLWKYSHQPATKVLDVAVLSLGLRNTLVPSLNSLWPRSATESVSLRNQSLSRDILLAGSTTGLATRPRAIDVYCRIENGKHEKVTRILPDGAGGGGLTFSHPVWASWRSDLDAPDSFADEVRDYVNGWLSGGGQYSFAGPINYTPTGFDDFLSIELYETRPGEYYFGSRVHELPNVFLPFVILVNGEFDCTGSGTSACIDTHIQFKVLEVVQGVHYLEADVEVMEVNCCNETYAEGDVVHVFDKACFFGDELPEDLVDRIGWAYRAKSSGKSPTFVAAGAAADGDGEITPGLPTGLETDDLMVLFVETFEGHAVTVSGWAAAPDSPVQASGTRLSVFWKRWQTGVTDPTISDSGDHQVARIIAFRGVTTDGDPWDVSASGVDATSDTSGSIPGATTVTPKCVVLVACSHRNDVGGTAQFSGWTNADLDNLTERIDNSTEAGNGGGIGVASGEKPATGAYGTTTVTLADASTKAMWTGALKPETCMFIVNGLCCPP